MKKVLFILTILLFTGCSVLDRQLKDINSIKLEDSMQSINITIDNKTYKLYLEDNDTVTSFIKLLPLELKMNDLNDNEKYTSLNSLLPTNHSVPNKINKGDVMLFGNNTLVIFYKSFNTTYSYTKIGYIDNLDNLGSESITVKITK